jgi:hypothetical protein
VGHCQHLISITPGTIARRNVGGQFEITSLSSDQGENVMDHREVMKLSDALDGRAEGLLDQAL